MADAIHSGASRPPEARIKVSNKRRVQLKFNQKMQFPKDIVDQIEATRLN